MGHPPAQNVHYSPDRVGLFPAALLGGALLDSDALPLGLLCGAHGRLHLLLLDGALLPLALQLRLHALVEGDHLLGALLAVAARDARPRRLLDGRAQRVVLQVEKLEVLQLPEGHRQVLELVAVQVQLLQAPQVPEVLGQILEAILGQVQPREVRQFAEGLLNGFIAKYTF